MTTDIAVEVVRVFTDEHGSFGNPLGVVISSAASAGREQAIAVELGFSETVFIDSITGDAAEIRIFTPARELPFAGHPTVGTAWWLRERGTPVTALEVPAGRVAVAGDDGEVLITARGSWAPDFAWHPLATPSAVDAFDGSVFDAGAHFVWAWLDESAGRIRSRMFAPAMDIVEDEATGAAAVALTARLGRDLTIHQGEGSVLRTRAVGGDLVQLGGHVVADDPRTL